MEPLSITDTVEQVKEATKELAAANAVGAEKARAFHASEDRIQTAREELAVAYGAFGEAITLSIS